MITPSPLERWFTNHPAACRHTVAPIAIQPPAWEALAAYLPPDWAGSDALVYGEPQGDPGLRALIAADYGVGPDQVMLSTGGVEANWLAMAALIRPGDRVIVQLPTYPQLACVAEALGGVLDPAFLLPPLKMVPRLPSPPKMELYGEFSEPGAGWAPDLPVRKFRMGAMM